MDSQYHNATLILAFSICCVWIHIKPFKSFTMFLDDDSCCGLLHRVPGSNHKTFCTICTTCKRNGTSNDSPNGSVNNNTSHCFHIAVMSLIMMLLICAFAYIVFIHQISITVNNLTIEDITKSIIVSAFVMIFTWLLPKIYLDPKTLLKYVKKKEA